MNTRIIGMAVAGTAAAVATGVVAKIVRSKREKKAEAKDTLLHDIKEYLYVMEDCINNIDPEATIDSLVPIALRMEKLTLEIARHTSTANVDYIDDSYVHAVLLQLRIMINRVYILYKKIIDNFHLSDELYADIIKKDCDRVMEQINAVKNAL